MADLGDLLTAQAATDEAPASIFQLLARRHAPPEWAYMQEVAPATGGGTGYADAVAINLWRSRGHAIFGYEVKVSRSDWLRELKQPEKAEPIFRYCDYWLLVAERDIVKPGELPDAWGHLERRGSTLHVVKQAPKLEPQPLTRAFFASLMRRAHEQIDSIAERNYRAKLAEAHAQNRKTIADGISRSTSHHKELQDKVTKFCAETGLDFNHWGGPPAKTIKLAQRLQELESWHGEGALQKLQNLASELEGAAATVRSAIVETGLDASAAPERALRTGE